MFNFALFTPPTIEPSPHNDMDSFTRGTLQLAGWLARTAADKKEVMSEKMAAARRMFGTDSGAAPPTQPGAQKKSADKKDDR